MQEYSRYHKAIYDNMQKLALRKDVLFVGQQVQFQDFYGTLKGISLDKRIEMPVAEEMQMGFCIGLALEGFLPICIYQRMDFMYRAMDQICNHLSLLPAVSRGYFAPKIIIRTTVGNDSPLNPGKQHTQDLTDIFKKASKFPVVKVTTEKEVNDAYKDAITLSSPMLIIEEQKLYR